MALDRPTLEFLAAAAAAAGPDAVPLWQLAAADARARSSAGRREPAPGPDMFSCQDIVLEAEDGGSFRIRILRPSASPAGVLVYLHGGGWVLHDIDAFDALGRLLADAANQTVVLVDYRKAPEHRFPAAAQDAWAALAWAWARRAELAFDGAPLFVGGDSAGGNLAAAAALRARDEGTVELAGQILLYPVTDADFTRGSYLDPLNRLLLQPEAMAWFWDQYVPAAEDRNLPQAAPLRAGSLAGLPPAVVITAEHDVLRDEGEAYAQALADDGVQVLFRRWPGQIHGFFSAVGVLPASAEVLELVAKRLTELSAG